MNRSQRFLILISTVGVLLFFLVINYFPFKDVLLNALYPKSKSYAASKLKIPQVDLKIAENGVEFDGILNSEDTRKYSLIWKIEGDAAGCVGRSWGISDSDESWNGTKDINSGSFTTKILDKKNPYVYSIDCQNAAGDAAGDSITINIGAKKNDQKIYLTQLEVSPKDKKADNLLNITLPKLSSVNLQWSLINSQTPYAICVATGSWPAGFKNLSNNTIFETFTLDLAKVYTYTVYCSNEGSHTQNTAIIVSE